MDRITERMLPEMPQCKSPTTFHSARLADVYSAFFILIAGGVTAVSIWIAERIWNKRRQMKDTIIRGMRQRHLMLNLSHLPHLPHLPQLPSFSQFHHLHFYSHHKKQSGLHHTNETQFDSTKRNERFVTDSSAYARDLRTLARISRSRKRDKDGADRSRGIVDYSRLGSRFYNRRGHNNLNKSTFLDLPRTKCSSDEKSGMSSCSTVFPFRE